jgi:hypothetical protein
MFPTGNGLHTHTSQRNQRPGRCWRFRFAVGSPAGTVLTLFVVICLSPSLDCPVRSTWHHFLRSMLCRSAPCHVAISPTTPPTSYLLSPTPPLVSHCAAGRFMGRTAKHRVHSDAVCPHHAAAAEGESELGAAGAVMCYTVLCCSVVSYSVNCTIATTTP